MSRVVLLKRLFSAGFGPRRVRMRGPLGDKTQGRIAASGVRAVVELAELCGWPRLPAGRGRRVVKVVGLREGQFSRREIVADQQRCSFPMPVPTRRVEVVPALVAS